MKQLRSIAVIPILFAGLYTGNAQAATFTESSDAGETLNTAQVIPLGTPLEFISGTLAGDADIFKIFLTGNQTFSATTRNAETDQIPINDLLDISTDLVADPQLFLFDSSGRGIYANNDNFGSLQPTLLSGNSSPIKSGFYYLAISGSGYDAVSNAERIFPDALSNQVLPTALDSKLAITGFAGTSSSSGRYTIAVTGVQTVPEPTSVLGILSLATWGAVFQLKNQKNKQK